MYWSAISTRLLVGIFTPAIRATKFSPVAGLLGTRPYRLKRAHALSLVEHDLVRKPLPTFRDHAPSLVEHDRVRKPAPTLRDHAPSLVEHDHRDHASHSDRVFTNANTTPSPLTILGSGIV